MLLLFLTFYNRAQLDLEPTFLLMVTQSLLVESLVSFLGRYQINSNCSLFPLSLLFGFSGGSCVVLSWGCVSAPWISLWTLQDSVGMPSSPGMLEKTRGWGMTVLRQLSQIPSDIEGYHFCADPGCLLLTCPQSEFPAQMPKAGYKMLSVSAFKSPNLSGCF